MINNKLTYISLFSSAGIGCYGFKLEEYECIATNELLEKRLNIQKINGKCKYESGYISGDITDSNTKDKIYKEIELWESMGNDKVDVVIATPPCQGMSVANHKKNENDINRNGLIIESINIIKKIQPRFFVFENVSAFWKTGCYYNGEVNSIGSIITAELEADYSIVHKVINFKNYGSNSSRTRTLVIGVNRRENKNILPIELLPDYRKEKTLKEVIGNMKPLEWGEYDDSDYYHSFRIYPQRMRSWITDLKEGESAFENVDEYKKPHRVVDGKLIINKSKNGDKYRRQIYDKVAPCIHTRNDQMASQNTVHPEEDRVFSIRELMKLMTIPDSFKWSDLSLEELNSLSLEEKKILSKKEEMNIRQSIGEAVPTEVLRQIAEKIKKYLFTPKLTKNIVSTIIEEENLKSLDNLKNFVIDNKNKLGFDNISKIIERANSKRLNLSAYYTNKELLEDIVDQLPDFSNYGEINILEPSVGIGNFLPLIIKKYDDIEKINLTVVDVDEDILDILKIVFNKESLPSNVNIKFIHGDYLNLNFGETFDLIIGNPPFSKLSSLEIKKYRESMDYSDTLTNLSGLFLEKALTEARNISFVLPKNILNTSEYKQTREKLKESNINAIIDFGEKGFDGVLIETVNLIISDKRQKNVMIKSIPKRISMSQSRSYIFDDKLPYWIIYRNHFFDSILSKMQFDIFNVFRDRQITTKLLTHNPINNIRVLKSRNISDDGNDIIDVEGYDSYISLDNASNLAVFKFINRDDVYLVPNMTYNPRVLKKENGYITNGSVAILIPKENIVLTKRQREYLSSKEFRLFYSIARNFQTRSLNIDTISVYWFGVLKGE